MKKIMKGRFAILKAFLLAAAVLTIAGCGSDSDVGGGGESANQCVSQTQVAAGVVDITNTCSQTIIVLANDNTTRYVLAPGETARDSSPTTGYGACFAPSEPEFVNANEFRCT